jgi:hypothetical protein
MGNSKNDPTTKTEGDNDKEDKDDGGGVSCRMNERVWWYVWDGVRSVGNGPGCLSLCVCACVAWARLGPDTVPYRIEWYGY